MKPLDKPSRPSRSAKPPATPSTISQGIRWMWQYVSPYPAWFGLTILAASIVVAADLLLAFSLQQLLNTALAADRGALGRATLLLLLAVSVGAYFSRLRRLNQGRFAAAAVRDLRQQLAQSISKTAYKNITAQQSGDLAARLNGDVDVVAQVVRNNFPDFSLQVITGFAAAVTLLIIDWRVMLLALSFTPWLMLFAHYLNKNAGKHFPAVYRQLGEATAAAEQGIRGIETVKAYTLEEQLANKQEGKYLGVFQAQMRAQFYVAILQPVCYSLARIPGVICAIYGGYLAAQGQFSPGTFVMLFRLLEYVATPTVYAPFALNQIHRAVAAIVRIDQVLRLEPERTDGGWVVDVSVQPIVRCEQVSFAYEPGTPVLADVSFQLATGQVTALVGTSGSGKSTLVNLLSGLYDAQGPGVSLFGHDIRLLSLAAIRQQVAVVSQDVYLFPGTILENLRFARPGASLEQVMAAAEAAGAHGFIGSLPDGYQTQVSEAGQNFSGGERQRIAIARAMLKDAPLLILDEPTSALDEKSEDIIWDALEQLMEGRTVLLVSHRLRKLNSVKQILVLEQGRLVEAGNHEQLLGQNGVYAALVRAQAARGEAQQMGEGEVASS